MGTTPPVAASGSEPIVEEPGRSLSLVVPPIPLLPSGHSAHLPTIALFRLLLHLRPNYIHSASNDIHTDGPRATARARG